MYASGRGVHKSTAEALHLYGMAAELRNAQRAQEPRRSENSRTSTNSSLGQVSLQMQENDPHGTATDAWCKALRTGSVRACDFVATTLFSCVSSKARIRR